MESAGAQQLVSQALAGRRAALADLVDLLTPVIQARVARTVLVRGSRGGRSGVRPLVEDLTQEVFLLLFSDGGRVLRGWRPERGLSLENFVGLVARRRALSILRTGKGSPWREDPTLDEELDGETPEADPETETASREQLRLVLERMREELSPLGWRLFELTMIEERPIREIETLTGMSPDAIYAWRSRLRKLAQRLGREQMSETA